MKIASFIFLFTFCLLAQRWGGNTNGWGGDSPAWGGNASAAGPACEWIVTNTNDSGAGSLRQMIADASAGDTVCFHDTLASDRITLASFLSIDKDLSIFGFGTNHVIISADSGSRVFVIDHANANNVVLRGLRITKGVHNLSSGTNQGGGIYIGTSSNDIFFHLDSCIVDSCQTGDPGDISRGGGIYAIHGSKVLITDCIIADNTVTSSSGANEKSGGGFSCFGDLDTVVIQRTAIIRNRVLSSGTVTTAGGGLQLNATYNMIENSTVSNNTTYRSGAGGVQFGNAGSVAKIEFCTVSNNTSGTFGTGGMITAAGTDTMRNSIVANGTGGSISDINGTIRYVAESLIENATGLTITSDGGGNITATDPGLAALAFDGETWIHAIDSGDPVYNTGDCSIGTGGDVDQRGISRPQSTECDMGAYEVE